MTYKIRFRRIYDEPSPDDGLRVLVDRIWPRGIRKEEAHVEEWLREVAPSTELRQWFGHDPDRFAEFRRRYLVELRTPERKQALQHLRDVADDSRITLLTASRDLEHSQAAVLAGLVNERHGGKTE
jgi:uncharacterized protein YeaO (DUF488 family)